LNTLGNIQRRLWDVDVDLPPSILHTLIALKQLTMISILHAIQTRVMYYLKLIKNHTLEQLVSYLNSASYAINITIP